MEKLGFGKRLVDFRKAAGLTQSEVAEKCNVTLRTIQRIESGSVKPRAFTIKTISEALGFDYYSTSNTGNDVNSKDQDSQLRNYTVLWYLKDLFNLKTHAMKKISILSVSTFLIGFLFINLINTIGQSVNNELPKSLIIELNEDKSIRRVEASFSHNLTLDSLVQIRNDLQDIGITIHYKLLEFNTQNLLVKIDCQVICNDGFSGSFAIDFRTQNRRERFGFYRDYAIDSKSPFGTGRLDSQ